MDAANTADAQNAPTGIWKSRTEREIPTAPTPIIVVVNERKNNGDSNSVAKLSTESDQAQTPPQRPGVPHARRRAFRPGPHGPRAAPAGARRRIRGASRALRQGPITTGRFTSRGVDQPTREEHSRAGCPRNNDRHHGRPPGRPESRRRRPCRRHDRRPQRDSNYCALGVSMLIDSFRWRHEERRRSPRLERVAMPGKLRVPEWTVSQTSVRNARGRNGISGRWRSCRVRGSSGGGSPTRSPVLRSASHCS